MHNLIIPELEVMKLTCSLKVTFISTMSISIFGYMIKNAKKISITLLSRKKTWPIIPEVVSVKKKKRKRREKYIKIVRPPLKSCKTHALRWDENTKQAWNDSTDSFASSWPDHYTSNQQSLNGC